MTINELFQSFSALKPAENEILLVELYNAYRKIKKDVESFDDFYFWGDMLLNDFDDVDKYLADASAVFRNIHDLKMIDEQFGGLTEEQVEIIRRFWTNINPEKLTKEKSVFLGLWSILYDLYTSFRVSLTGKNIAYEGMIFRDVVENHLNEISTGLQWEVFHFIGFNALNKCEKALMLYLKKDGRGRFYWDYDKSYITGSRLNSAGFFLRDNIAGLGNDMPEDWNYDTYLSGDNKKIKRRIINTSSDIAQVKLLPELISGLPGLSSDNAHQTAVILADENLLIPVLSSLPETIDDVNITMGFPLRHTIVYTFISRILEMQRNSKVEEGNTFFSLHDVNRIISNIPISGLMTVSDKVILNELNEKKQLWVPESRFKGSVILSEIFNKPSSPKVFSGYLKKLLMLVSPGNTGEGEEQERESARRMMTDEFIYRVLLVLNRLDYAFADSGINLAVNTWTNILERILNLQSIPFTGEPLTGVQVMGILESRALDFKNIIMLSVNEGVLPAVTASSSFIPFTLREAFRLPSINHQESIFAYHFFRLLHRAENVTFIYNSNSEGLRSGEISRFLQQMKYGPDPEPKMIDLSFSIKSQELISETVERTEEHTRRLISRFPGNTDGKSGYISPSAINTWLNCRMKFYYKYVNGLEEKEKISEDIDPAKLGTLLHEAIRDLYDKYRGKVLNAGEIESMIHNRKEIVRSINTSINENFRSESDPIAGGNELIVKEVLMVFIERILQRDKNYAPFKIISFEETYGFPMSLKTPDGFLNILTGGKIDRIDIKGGITRIIDYKTGNVADSIHSVDQLFEEDRDKDLDGWLQTLIYCESYLSKNPDIKLLPAIYKIRKVPGNDISEMLLIKPDMLLDDYYVVRNEFLENLNVILGKIFSNAEPFTMTKKPWGKCTYCPYRVLCKR